MQAQTQSRCCRAQVKVLKHEPRVAHIMSNYEPTRVMETWTLQYMSGNWFFSAKNMTQQHKQYNSNYDNSTQVHRPVLEIIKIYLSHEYSYILSICWDMLYLSIRLNEDCWLHSFNCIKTHTVIPNTDVDTVESDSKLFGTIDRDLPASDDTFTSWKMAENFLFTPW